MTASYDLSFDQLDDLLRAVPPEWLEVVIHQQMPMFHMEHCVFCAFLSPGTDATNCGRPCDRTTSSWGPRRHGTPAEGRRRLPEHPVQRRAADAAEYLPAPGGRGARHLRVEFLDDTPEEVARTLALYATPWPAAATRGRSGGT